ncbi:MAG: rod shape-determining protein RodA [Candidatus Cloacimonetes bacterium]|jgi:rod shape determining protein RodA|nr:rod shape-determining protein RodA [Candidatus Cloacimonadota bacterium]MBT4333819.1 rod shape-determining protein RodA [Candidatus Cloacimonadota bacterium]MBT5419364.1 rod shape-determining protein RodA [Candidatus Cloacimonadota bacterium]
MKKFEWIIFGLLIFLLFIGIFSIYTASSTRTGDNFIFTNYYIKQFFWVLISMFVLFLLLKAPNAIVEISIFPIYIFTILLLILVLFLPEINGSHRWISLGPINFQPSELAKLFTIMALSKLISKPFLNDGQILFRSFVITIIPVVLILLEPDLGTSLTFFVILFSILLVSDLPKFYLVLIISPILSILFSFSIWIFIAYALLLIYILYRSNLDKVLIGFAVAINTFIFFITPIFWNSLKDYQQNRLLTFINPMRDPFGAGYQIIQSKIAIGSGGIFGKGFLMGTQKNMNFLPEHHTDFIFSVIGEEFGFFGCAFILLIYFLFLYKIAKSIIKIKRKEYRYVSVGILAYITFQIFINIGMNLGIVPTTGIPLPFISYGGSNLLINVTAIGLILKYLNERSIFA